MWVAPVQCRTDHVGRARTMPHRPRGSRPYNTAPTMWVAPVQCRTAPAQNCQSLIHSHHSNSICCREENPTAVRPHVFDPSYPCTGTIGTSSTIASLAIKLNRCNSAATAPPCFVPHSAGTDPDHTPLNGCVARPRSRKSNVEQRPTGPQPAPKQHTAQFNRGGWGCGAEGAALEERAGNWKHAAPQAPQKNGITKLRRRRRRKSEKHGAAGAVGATKVTSKAT
eukprot:gene13211-biopygen3493